MNTLESIAITSPFGKAEECALFVVDDATCPFTLSDITNTNQEYTFSFWAKSEAEGSLSIYNKKHATSTGWERYKITFTAESNDLLLFFDVAGTYYIYHPQLEIGNMATDWTPAPEDVDSAIETKGDELAQSIVEQSASLTATCEGMILEALKTYTETDDFDSFKSTIESQLALLADEMTLKFTQTTTELESVNADLQNKFNTITKYFTFDINGMTIGQLDNPYKVIIDNDRYSMTANGAEVMWISNGEVHTPEISITHKMNLFGLVFEKDAAGNVNCEYVGGE